MKDIGDIIKATSPALTGQAGADFEHCVQAEFVATMLMRGQAPCLSRGQINRICLQAEHLGYKTDDVLVFVQDMSGRSSRLISQIKRGLSFAASDKEFCKTLVEAWQDFQDPKLFTRQRDALAIITGPGSKKDLAHVRSMLSYAKYSADATEFLGKLDAYSKQKRKYFDVFKAVLSVAGHSLSDVDLWEFLCHLYWLPYDLDEAADSSHLTLVLNMIDLAKAPGAPESHLIWARIKDWIADNDKNAGTITSDRMPPDICDFFKGTEGILSGTALKRIEERTTVILHGFRDTIAGHTHIERSAYRQRVAHFVETEHCVIVTGGPGTGKSALAKDVLRHIGERVPVFAIKSDELNCSVLDRLFTAAGISETLSGLSARFSMLGRKVLYIDALERILEFDDQEVLQQLIEFVRADPTWTIFATARTLSFTYINNYCLAPAGIYPITVSIGHLTDDELAIVEQAHPGVIPLLQNQKIRNLLRVPLYLSFACQIDWQTSGLPANTIDETQLRKMLWGAIVEKQSYQKDGLPSRRAKTFITVARERSKHMWPFVAVKDIDLEALEHLIKDELIVEYEGQYAPAHDLLEEWALQHYISSQFAELGEQRARFLDAVGTGPALRRSLRVWLSEQLKDTASDDVQRFAFACLNDISIPQYWRDEITIAMLSGPSASIYLNANRDELLASRSALLIRLLHLMRIACREPDTAILRSLLPGQWTKGHDILSTAFLKASGKAWDATIGFLAQNLGSLTLDIMPSACEVLKDWASGLTFIESGQTARQAGILGLHLLDFTVDHRHRKHQESVSKALLKLAPAITDEIKMLIDRLIALPFRNRRDYEQFIDSALNTLWNEGLCRVLPESVVALSRAQWFLEKKESEWWEDRHIDNDGYFGIRKHWSGHDGITASALYGPFSNLLKYHPAIALRFITELINQASDSYVMSNLDFEPNEREEHRVTVPLNENDTRKQWISNRLWQIYRATSVAPRIVESALMALEDWLLKKAEGDEDIRSPFEFLLKETNSCAMSAMLASVALAYPRKLDEALLPLLRVPEYFHLDICRQVHEQTHKVDFTEFGLPPLGWDKVYTEERKSAERREHRKKSLEDLVRDLQFTKLREKVWAIIDGYYNALPPVESQTEWHKTWRIALLRMDIRKFKAETDTGNGRILFTPPEPEPELKKIQEKAADNHERMERFVSLMTWAVQRFERKEMATDPFPTWHIAYERAREIEDYLCHAKSSNDLLLYDECPLWCASILVRDFWDELPSDVRTWCVNHIQEAVVADANSFSAITDAMISPLSAKAAAAYVLPALVAKVVGDQSVPVREAVCIGICHEVDVIRAHVACGIRDFIWSYDPQFGLQCFRGMLDWSKLRVSLSKHYRMRRLDDSMNHGKVIQDARNALLHRISQGESSFPPYPEKLMIGEYSPFIIRQLLLMIPIKAVPPEITDFYKALLPSVLYYVDVHENRRNDSNGYADYHFEFAHEFCSAFARFLLNQEGEALSSFSKILADSVQNVPEFISDVMGKLIHEVDRHNEVAETFWQVWAAIKDQLLQAIIGRRSNLSRDHGYGKLLRSIILVGIPWKDSAREWKPLALHSEYLENLYKSVGTTPVGFSAYIYLLDSIGSTYLPGALKWLAASLAEDKKGELLSDDNTVFLLERIIRNQLFKESGAIRKDRGLQQAVLTLTEGLIEQGSSGAFLLRERFVGMHCSLRFD